MNSICFLPKYINTLENFNYIHYNGNVLPRIHLNSINSEQIEKPNIFSYEFSKGSNYNDNDK